MQHDPALLQPISFRRNERIRLRAGLCQNGIFERTQSAKGAEAQRGDSVIGPFRLCVSAAYALCVFLRGGIGANRRGLLRTMLSGVREVGLGGRVACEAVGGAGKLIRQFMSNAARRDATALRPAGCLTPRALRPEKRRADTRSIHDRGVCRSGTPPARASGEGGVVAKNLIISRVWLPSRWRWGRRRCGRGVRPCL